MPSIYKLSHYLSLMVCLVYNYFKKLQPIGRVGGMCGGCGE